MPDAPGPVPDRAAAERPGCKYWCDYRDTSHEGPCLPNNTRRIADLEAELDRQRVIVRAAEALVECVNEGHDLDDNSDHPLWNRLDALAAAVRAEGEGQ